MFDNFSEVEKKYLNELKMNLWEHPGEYFFRYYRNFNEFKEINYSMWIGQWQYVSSGFSMLFETFKILGQVASSLFALNFSNAMSLTHDAAKEFGTALTKLTLALGLLCLNLCRFTTLFVATYYPQLLFASLTVCSASLYIMTFGNPLCEAFSLISFSVCLGIFGASIVGPSKNIPKKKEKEKLLDLKFFLESCEEIFNEQTQVHERLIIFVEQLNLTAQALSQELRFFSNPELFAKLKRELYEDISFSKAFSELLASYPVISFASVPGDRCYANMMLTELSEHHAKVMSMVELLEKKITKKPENEAQAYNFLSAK
ncbi:hypothetical protein [Legionella saoudiensis]|uniref:hypothetical protein n=1 Tax=Legionella saoudiensis TaxID=1750561 RepID=UPI000731D4E2|nr:hypothetical protein [Legionella saoudiensis]